MSGAAADLGGPAVVEHRLKEKESNAQGYTDLQSDISLDVTTSMLHACMFGLPFGCKKASAFAQMANNHPTQ